MKNIIFLFTLLLLAGANVKAQSVCETVTAEAYYEEPQPSTFRLFGVRVSLAEFYGVDVTVTGTISAENESRPPRPFTITIIAGNSSAQTTANYYRTHLGEGAIVSVSSVTPCPIAYEPEPTRICGSDFAAYGLEGVNFSTALDNIGTWHNDYQSYLFAEMQSNNIDLNHPDIQVFIQGKTRLFFATRGITATNNPLPGNFDVSDTSWINPSLSNEALTILNDLKNLAYSYDEVNHDNYIAQIMVLKTRALALQSDLEVFQVGIPITVAVNSFNYWKDNGNIWTDYLTGPASISFNNLNNSLSEFKISKSGPNPAPIQLASMYTTTQFKACPINLKQLGGADIAGAVSGAIGGGVGAGPAGAVAGGLLGGAVGSSYNIVGQALKCAPGAVGQVARWLSDWF